MVDLTTSPPSLAAGTNPIPIGNSGQDLSLTPDGRFLLACDGALAQPISVIEVAARAEVSIFMLGTGCCAIEAAPDGSVLAASFNGQTVHRLLLDGAGSLSDTGELLPAGGRPNNLFRAPGGGSGLVITREARTIRSFSVPGLAEGATRALTGTFGIAGLVHPAGDRVYACSQVGTSGPEGAIDVFGYDVATGVLSDTPSLTIPIASTLTFLGIDQLAIHPNGHKIYVPQPGAVHVYDAGTGTLLAELRAPSPGTPTGIFVAGNRPPTVACPPPVSVPADSPAGATVTSSVQVEDPDGNALALEWRVDGEAVRVESLPAAGPPNQGSLSLTHTYAVGTHTLSVTVSDGIDTPVGCSTGVTVTSDDTVAPRLAASVFFPLLWPPDQRLVRIGLRASATDDRDPAPVVRVAVYSDEDDYEPSSGDEECGEVPDQSPDAREIAPGTLRLRAGRRPGGDGRVYLIVVTAHDASGNRSFRYLTVMVPRQLTLCDLISVLLQAHAAREQCRAAGGAPPPGYFVIGDGPVVGDRQ